MTSTPFHVWLSQELERQDRKQSWLARQTGISEGCISGYLSGKGQPKVAQLVMICDALKIPVWIPARLIAETEKEKILARREKKVKTVVSMIPVPKTEAPEKETGSESGKTTKAAEGGNA